MGSTRAHIVRAFLEALGYQVRAILETIQTETGLHVDRLHLGGGVSASDEACQIQADLIGIPTIRPHFTETTARAAAMLAGIGSGAWKSPDHLPPLLARSTYRCLARDPGPVTPGPRPCWGGWIGGKWFEISTQGQ